MNVKPSANLVKLRRDDFDAAWRVAGIEAFIHPAVRMTQKVNDQVA
jgi:hypothetical protein